MKTNRALLLRLTKSILCALLFVTRNHAFVLTHGSGRGGQTISVIESAQFYEKSYTENFSEKSFTSTQLFSSSNTNQQPLYDGTNYTFPDTTTPDGIAEAMEVSFVHGVMGLRTGDITILKLFVVSVMSGYQFGFTIEEIQAALADCTIETANRPLLPEEIELRYTWYSVIYLTLLKMNHATIKKEAVKASIPAKIQKSYGDLIEDMVAQNQQDDKEPVSVEELLKNAAESDSTTGDQNLSEIDRAILLQSLRVVNLVFVVVRESLEAGPSGSGQVPPTPPIKGAFD